MPSIRIEMELGHEEIRQTLSFNNVSFFNIEGGISSDKLCFPVFDGDPPSVAQILDIWLTYNKGIVEYIFLLNDERYIKIQTSKRRGRKTRE